MINYNISIHEIHLQIHKTLKQPFKYWYIWLKICLAVSYRTSSLSFSYWYKPNWLCSKHLLSTGIHLVALQLCNSNQAKHAIPCHGLVATLATPQLVNVGFNDDQLKRISEQDAQTAPCHTQLGPLDTVLRRAQLPLQTTHIWPQMTESSPLSFI